MEKIYGQYLKLKKLLPDDCLRIIIICFNDDNSLLFSVCLYLKKTSLNISNYS